MGYYSRGATNGPSPRSGENITQLRDGKHKPTPVRIQRPRAVRPAVSVPGGSTATLLLISLCSLRHRSINEKMTYPFVGGGRNSLAMAIAHFLGFRDRVRLGYPRAIKRFQWKYYILELIDSHHSVAI